MVFSLLFAWAAVTLHINHVVAGAIMNILAFGFTRYFMNVFYHIQGTSPALPVTLHHYKYALPFLGSLPVVGPAFFNQTPIVYLSLDCSHCVGVDTRPDPARPFRPGLGRASHGV